MAFSVNIELIPNKIYSAYFDEWSSWSSCSRTCGEGVSQRYRNCWNEDFQNTCVGERIENELCSVVQILKICGYYNFKKI